LLRTHWITNPSAAKAYYQASDYYTKSTGDWLGKGTKMLGLQGEARQEDFFALCDNLDPRTGLPLTTYSRRPTSRHRPEFQLHEVGRHRPRAGRREQPRR
jgi:hypothetical protein